MKRSKLVKCVPIIGIGAVVIVMAVLRNKDAAPVENHMQPEISEIDQSPAQDSDTPVDIQSESPSDTPKQTDIPSSDSTGSPKPDAVPAVVETNLTESGDVAPDGSRIYTMETLPMDQSGTYWVRDADGNVEQISIDVLGPDSPVGFRE